MIFFGKRFYLTLVLHGPDDRGVFFEKDEISSDATS